LYFYHTTASSLDEYVCSTGCETTSTGLSQDLFYDDRHTAKNNQFTNQVFCTAQCHSGLFTSGTKLCTDTCANNAENDISINKWIGDHLWHTTAAVNQDKLKIYRDLDGKSCVATCSSSAYAYRLKDNAGTFVDNICSSTCPPALDPEPATIGSKNHYRVTQTLPNTQKLCLRECEPVSSIFYVVDGLTPYPCINTCPYAYKIHSDTYLHNNARICVTTCGNGFYLTKDANGVWFCDSNCKDSGAYFFINSRGDKECLPDSTDALGCRITTPNSLRLTEDHAIESKLVYHVEINGKKQCQRTCPAPYYHTTNKLCMNNCSNSFFRERPILQPTPQAIGADGEVSATNYYYICTPNQCATDDFFKIEGG
jgi:hypothetical protein